MKPKIIGLTGRAGSGKSFVGDILCTEHCYTRVKFAGALKAMTRALLHHARVPDSEHYAYLEGDKKETPSAALAGQTPRYVMQTLGEEWGRRLIHPDLWAMIALQEINWHLDRQMIVVVDDVRYDNEAQMILANGGEIWKIIRIFNDLPYSHKSEQGVSPELITRRFDNSGSEHQTGLLVDYFINGGA
jgi:hypothetical protein